MEDSDGACYRGDQNTLIMKKIFGFFIVLMLMFIPAKVFCQDELLIGLIPEENIFLQMDRHRPLADYLSGKLGINVRLTILSRYVDIIDSFVSREMDGAFFGVFTGVLAMEKLGVEPVARPVNIDGSATVQSYIFVRQDSGIKNVDDMKNKRFAFVDRATVTGYLFGIAFLRERGVVNIDKYFREYYFTGSHDAAVYSVLDNRADIGIAKSKVFKRMIGKDPIIKDELKVLAVSNEFPDTTLCLRKDLPDNIKSKIKEILLNMDKEDEGRKVLGKLMALRFVEAKKDDFRPFFELADKAGINIKRYKYTR